VNEQGEEAADQEEPEEELGEEGAESTHGGRIVESGWWPTAWEPEAEKEASRQSKSEVFAR
jgi:hypothetical protein